LGITWKPATDCGFVQRQGVVERSGDNEYHRSWFRDTERQKSAGILSCLQLAAQQPYCVANCSLHWALC
jgi:hypothetical protein